MRFYNSFTYIFIVSLACLLSWACSSKKKTEKVKFMKNLSAHYNIYFNAKQLLEESEKSLTQARDNDFNNILPLFPIPDEESASRENENLNTVIQKANTIALEKYESNWLDDAFLLLAEAQYLKGDFYNSVEYFNYVSTTFPDEKRNKLKAYLGLVKSDFALNKLADADSVLQLANALKLKYDKDLLAVTNAEMAKRKDDIPNAIKYLEDAVGQTKDRYHKIRWRYILAQLQEMNNESAKAYKNYQKIVKSNASFEMSFNANLSKIRITESKAGKEFDKIATLKKLLREDKNQDFKEQIYYQIANAYFEKNDLKKTGDFFRQSVHTQPSTSKQKGLSYLKLADLNFNNLKDYKQAQLYYDSTLQFLPKNYPEYNNLSVKANNLQYLADRLTIIENQKSRLVLANLTDDELESKFQQTIKQRERDMAQAKTDVLPNQNISIQDFTNANKNAGSFYFYNAAALSQGSNEFINRWGNRKLTDNWRVSSSILGVNPNNLAASQNASIDDNIASVANNVDSLRARFIRDVPFSPADKQIANDKISKSLYEIGIFYKDVLNNKEESADAFYAILLNYPNTENAPNIYYQMYRLMQEINPPKAEDYKKQLIEKFPTSIYAKTITDPDFGKEEKALDEKVKAYYEDVFTLYQNKEYDQVIQKINEYKKDFGSFRKLSPQVAYLEALSIGNTNKTPRFLASLNEIVTNYPDDTEITPLVKAQIDYINTNKQIFERRKTALTNFDPNGNIISGKQIIVFKQAEKDIPLDEKKLQNNSTAGITESKPNESKVINEKEVLKPSTPVINKEIVFNTNERQRYAILFDFKDGNANIAKPFSSLSQYFYSKFDPSTVKLLIRAVDDKNKFIIITGSFYTKDQTQKVLDELQPNLQKIMEGFDKKYLTLVVSESNLNLLKDNNAVDQYLKSVSGKK